MLEWVILFHGDLLTKEQLDSVHASRSIENSAKARFQHIIFIPGLFHYKMACVDTFWRIWVKPKEGRQDESSMMEHMGTLRPDDTGKFGSLPGFRMVHDAINHDLTASLLDCWLLEAKKRFPSCSSLDDFAAAGLSWEEIVAMSEDIVENYVATSPVITELRDKRPQHRDHRFENQILRNRNELLYIDMCYAINAGDIGCVEASIAPWVLMFRATGKHKYATHMLNFIKDLKDRYPPELSRIIRMNWLVNPSGRPDSFCGVDWLVELNNLYTKVIYAGGSSNHTINHIIKESPLIELYRECHMAVEHGFHLVNQTVWHAPPNMKLIFRLLGKKFTKNTPHAFTVGQNCYSANIEDETDEPTGIEPDDLGAEFT
ncbi:hypothetical protein BT96DRAFT_953220 [Gymnopus androsaceus JB14]|uniref:DUF6589 domain-containing protein n=1 Tax=Gymnopus androsaceus JB14 TaxID=1447944 RepID=A0A6A4IH01_9AGAR|nr:hypothetical protein BT96DRAFT_953220 [Gymnopus androsaceus JB14]